MCRRIISHLQKRCQEKENSLAQLTIEQGRDRTNDLMRRVLLGSLFSIIAAGLVFTDIQVITSLGNQLSYVFISIFLGFAAIILILLLLSRWWKCAIYAAEWFYRSLVSPILFPIILMSIFLRIFYVAKNGLPMADSLSWFLLIFLAIYFVLLIVFMENTRLIWAQRLKVGSLYLALLALIQAIQISSAPQQLTYELYDKNVMDQYYCLIFQLGAIIFLIISFILDYTNQPNQQR